MVNLKKEQQAILDSLGHDVADYRKQVGKLEAQLRAAKAVLKAKLLRSVVEAMEAGSLPVTKVYGEAFGYTQVTSLRSALGLPTTGPFLQTAKDALLVEPVKVGEDDDEEIVIKLDPSDALSYRRLSNDKNYNAEVIDGETVYEFTVYDWDEVREVYLTSQNDTDPSEAVLNLVRQNVENAHFAWETY